MLKQAEKWFPDLGTMVSGHLLIYVISAKGNHERIIPGVILFSSFIRMRGDDNSVFINL